MAQLTIAKMGEAIKTHYLPTIQYQMDNEADEFITELEKNSNDVNFVSGEAKFAMRYGRNGGIGNRAEDGDLPTPNSRKTKQATLITRNIYAQLQFTDKVMKATKSSLASFVDVMTQEFDDAMIDAKDSVGRQAHGDHKGILATCAGAATDSAIQAVDDVTYLAPGMLVDIVASNGTVKYAECEIVDVDYDAENMILAAAPGGTVANTDVVVVTGSYGLELTGLKEVFDSTGTSLYGITRADHKWVNPIVQPVNGEIDELKMQGCIDITKRRTGAVIDFIICDDGSARAFQYMQQVFKRNTEYTKLKGGYEVMSYNKIPITKSKYCRKQSMYMLAKKDWKVHRLGDWEWLDADGAVLSRVPGKAAWQATLTFYGDLGCSRPGGQVLLTGITAH